MTRSSGSQTKLCDLIKEMTTEGEISSCESGLDRNIGRKFTNHSVDCKNVDIKNKSVVYFAALVVGGVLCLKFNLDTIFAVVSVEGALYPAYLATRSLVTVIVAIASKSNRDQRIKDSDNLRSQKHPPDVEKLGNDSFNLSLWVVRIAPVSY